MNNKLTNLISTLLFTTMLLLVVGCDSDDDIAGPDTSELFATWSHTSVTINGVDENVADFFDWSPETVDLHSTFNENSTFDVVELDASNDTLYTESGTLTINGTQLILTATSANGTAITPRVNFDGTWVISGNTLTLTAVDGDTVIITLTKVI